MTLLSSAKYPTPPALGMHFMDDTMFMRLLLHPKTAGSTIPFFVIADYDNAPQITTA